MPRFPHPRLVKRCVPRKVALVVAVLLSQSCMEPLYFEGPPPGTATMSIRVPSVDTLSAPTLYGRSIVRAHLALEWSIPPRDFRAHPHLVYLSGGLSGNWTRKLTLPAPEGVLLDTLTCESGQIDARLMVDLGSDYLLSLWQGSVAAKATGP